MTTAITPKSEKANPTLAAELAAEVERQRNAPVSSIDAMTTAENRRQAAEAERAAAERAALLVEYRGILGRRKNPAGDDAGRLVEVAAGLKFDRRRIASDIKTLDHINELSQLATEKSIKQATAALLEATAAREAVELAAKKLRDSRVAFDHARQHHAECCGAAASIERTKTEHPDLFPHESDF
jgi:hypothetical protein